MQEAKAQLMLTGMLLCRRNMLGIATNTSLNILSRVVASFRIQWYDDGTFQKRQPTTEHATDATHTHTHTHARTHTHAHYGQCMCIKWDQWNHE